MPAGSRPGRIAEVDALKGLAIILVVLGHSIANADPATFAQNPVFIVVYSFHMPLFAAMSGFLAFGRISRAPGHVIARRFKQLMVPYFAWAALSYVLYGDYKLMGPVRYMASVAVNPHTAHALWFLYALFECYLVFVTIRMLTRSDRILAGSALAVALLSLTAAGGTSSFLGLLQFVLIYPGFVGGYFIAKYRERVVGARTLVIIISACVYAVTLALLWPAASGSPAWIQPLLALSREYGLRGDRFATFYSAVAGFAATLPLLKYVCSFSAILGLFAAFHYVRGVPLDRLAWTGRHSMGLYPTHSLVIAGALLLLPSIGWVALFAVALFGGLAIAVALEGTAITRRALLGQWPRPTPPLTAEKA